MALPVLAQPAASVHQVSENVAQVRAALDGDLRTAMELAERSGLPVSVVGACLAVLRRRGEAELDVSGRKARWRRSDVPRTATKPG